jgi:hypothetical protein
MLSEVVVPPPNCFAYRINHFANPRLAKWFVRGTPSPTRLHPASKSSFLCTPTPIGLLTTLLKLANFGELRRRLCKVNFSRLRRSSPKPLWPAAHRPLKPAALQQPNWLYSKENIHRGGRQFRINTLIYASLVVLHCYTRTAQVTGYKAATLAFLMLQNASF